MEKKIQGMTIEVKNNNPREFGGLLHKTKRDILGKTGGKF